MRKPKTSLFTLKNPKTPPLIRVSTKKTKAQELKERFPGRTTKPKGPIVGEGYTQSHDRALKSLKQLYGGSK